MATLQMGSHGDEVRRLQEALVNKGYFVGSVDGDFGEKTAAAVAYLQSTHGLRIDGIAGEQVRDVLDIGGSVSMGVAPHWPDLDVVSGDTTEFPVEIESLGGDFAQVEVRVVVWFRGPSVETHAEAIVTAAEGTRAIARVPIPEDARSHEGEVHWTGVVYDLQGTALTDEGMGSFRVDLPERVS